MNNVSLFGYHLTFDAEMTWPTDSGYFINHFNNGDRTIPANRELEYYADNSPGAAGNPFAYQGSELTITASPVAVGKLPYTSGMLSTGGDFYQNQGYFEIRADVTGTSGFWPAFWLYCDTGGEIDVLEQPNLDGPDNYWTSTKSITGDTGGYVNAGVNVSAGYHTYGVMWTSTAIEFTFDGNYIGYWTATPAQLQTAKMYLIANLAVGGWPPAPAAGATAQFKIDYIRAYSTDPAIPDWWNEDPAVSPDGATIAPYTLPVLPALGAGMDTLVLQLSEDSFQGADQQDDAQFTVSVDGVQLGGTMTASASHVFQQTQALDIRGNFAAGKHTVALTFLNDYYDSATRGDRNLYLTQATIDGNSIAYSSISYYADKTDGFSFSVNDPFQPAIVLGAGPDMLTLQVAEDAYAGDAQFTISVDGVQIGGVQTATVLKSSGSTQAFDLLGSFSAGSHKVSVNFLNDAWGGSSSTDRNLYVTQASFDNVAIPSSSLSLLNGPPQSFSFQSLSTSADTLTLGVSEDAWKGDAQYTVSVDNVLVGGANTPTIYTATASHAAGQINLQTITGSWGKGAHTIGVSFINDAWGGNSSMDRNLYLNSVKYGGAAVPMSTVSLDTDITVNVSTATTAVNPSLLTLYMAEDAFQGDTQFSIAIDGSAVGGTQTVTASHNTGASQAFSFADVLAAGTHDVAISYLNDLTAPNAIVAGDRNLYLVGADMGGTPQSSTSWSGAFATNGTQHFSLVVPAKP